MGAVKDGFGNTFRDYNTDGLPASGAHKVTKSEARALGATVEDALSAIQLAGAVNYKYATKALMDAFTGAADGALALVWNDSTGTNNGYYGWNDGGNVWVKSPFLDAGAAIEEARVEALADIEAARDEAVGALNAEVSSKTMPPGVADVAHDALERVIEQTRESDGVKQFGAIDSEDINGVSRRRFAAMYAMAFRNARYRGPVNFPFDINIWLQSGQSNSEGADAYAVVSTDVIAGVLMMDAIRQRTFVGTRYASGLTAAAEVVSSGTVETAGGTFGETGMLAGCEMVMKLVEEENRSTYAQHRKILVPMTIGRSSSDVSAWSYGTSYFTQVSAALTAIKALTTTAGSIHYKKTVGIIGLTWAWGAQGYDDQLSKSAWKSKLLTYFGQIDTYMGRDIFDQPIGSIPIGIFQTAAHGPRNAVSYSSPLNSRVNPVGAEAENELAEESSGRISIINPEGPLFYSEITGTGATSGVHHSANQEREKGAWGGWWLKRVAIDRESWKNHLPTVEITGAREITITDPDVDTALYELRPQTTGLSPGSMLVNYGLFAYDSSDDALRNTALVPAGGVEITGPNTLVMTASADLPAAVKVRYSASDPSGIHGNILERGLIEEMVPSLLINGVQKPLRRWIPCFDREAV